MLAAVDCRPSPVLPCLSITVYADDAPQFNPTLKLIHPLQKQDEKGSDIQQRQNVTKSGLNIPTALLSDVLTSLR